MKPQQPAGLTKPGLLELAASAVEARRQLAAGSDAAVDPSSAAAADKTSANGSSTMAAQKSS